MEHNRVVELGSLIKPAKTIRCGDDYYPVLSMTMHDGLVFQEEKFKKEVASKNKADYKVVFKNQLVVGFPIDEGVLATQRIVDAGIVSPAYGIWDVDQSKIHPEFLEWALRSARALDYYRAKLRGSTARRRSLPTETFLKFTLPLPSISEQMHILDIIHKLQVMLRSRQQQLAKLDELVKARFIEMFGDPVSNQKEWKLVPLGKRCKIITGNTPSRAELENYGEFIEWIKSDNINTPFMFIIKAQECLSKTGFEKCRFVEAGSLLMTCIAGSINCIGNVAVTDRRVAFNQQINAIVPAKDKVVYLYWLMMLSKPVINRTINMALKGILSKRQLAEMEFPFPPLDLQEKFEGLVEKVNKSRRFIQKSLEQMEILKKALMQKYFGYIDRENYI